MKVYTDARVPVKSWAVEVEQGALDQARNLANLPFALRHVALMPDAHPGYGMPIGGVLFADKVVVPGAIGVDIGCGVVLADTNLNAGDLDGALQAVLDGIARRVPVGNGGRSAEFGRHDSAETILEQIGMTRPASVLDAWWQASLKQHKTLGGGNHFLEVQRGKHDSVYVMVHSGSRGLGKKICDHYQKIALALNKKWYSDLSDPALAYLPASTPEFSDYWSAMNFALAWAKSSRAGMLGAVELAFRDVFPAFEITYSLDVQHNYAAWENHAGSNGIVHRKGAVRARLGETVLIPGSMGTASYVGVGLGSDLSFDTCQHGAGRRSGRRAFERSLGSNDDAQATFDFQMHGVLLGGNARNARDELPTAYKEIESVMDASTDLVERTLRLTPLGVLKG